MSAVDGRRDALCCTCGRLRTVTDAGAVRAARRVSVSEHPLPGQDAGWRCLTELKCSTCGLVTRHALIREDPYRDYAEKRDREVDLSRRLAVFKLKAFRSVATTVWEIAAAELRVESAPVEVVQYDDERGLQVRVCMDWEPGQLVECLDEAAGLVVDLDQLGSWSTGSRGRRWRGAAVRSGL